MVACSASVPPGYLEEHPPDGDLPSGVTRNHFIKGGARSPSGPSPVLRRKADGSASRPYRAGDSRGVLLISSAAGQILAES